MITIHRTKTSNNFTIIHNSILQDEALSLPAIGLLVYLISKPENWKILPKYLATKLYKKEDSKAGYRYILNLIQEIENSGYCTKKRNSDGTIDYYIYDTKLNPNVEKLHKDKPDVENPHVKKLHTNKEQIQYKEKNINKEDGQSLLFSNWYNLYPKKVKKLRASNLFKKLNKRELDILMPATKLYIAYKQDNGEYFQNPDTFLNQKVFLDFTDDIQQKKEEVRQIDKAHSIATALAKKILTNEGVDFSVIEQEVMTDSKMTAQYASTITQDELISFLKPYIKDRLC